MAEAIARKIFKEKKMNAAVSSRGLSVFSALPISENAASVLYNHGIEYGSHISTPLNQDDLISADVILTMTEQLKNVLITCEPDAESKVYTVYEYITGENKDVADPYGGDYETYKSCFEELYALIDKLEIKEMSEE